jgi:hypothetical protein
MPLGCLYRDSAQPGKNWIGHLGLLVQTKIGESPSSDGARWLASKSDLPAARGRGTGGRGASPRGGDLDLG